VEVHHGAVVRLAGREREVATLEQALQRARSGEGGVVAVSGDPGIGKTTLARALGRVAAQLGVPALWARGVEFGAPAYWPWLQVLRARVEQVGDAALRVDAGWGAAELVRLAPDLGPRLGVEPSVGDDDRLRLFNAVGGVLRAAGDQTGLLVVMDDLLWG
jgi:Mrp family chromosome partitioning ATPase